MENNFRIGTRRSPLAIKQVEEFIALTKKISPDIEPEIFELDTSGDMDKSIPISEIEGTDFFTREIDRALLDGKIDIAVHSAKDLPETLPAGLMIAAITESIDRHDVLVSKNGLKLRELSKGAKIATSSIRRKTALKAFRDDLQIVDIRGNINERLQTLDTSDLDAVLIASAGLIRLGLVDRITEWLPFLIMQPHPLQGSLAVVVREDSNELISLLKKIDYRNGFHG